MESNRYHVDLLIAQCPSYIVQQMGDKILYNIAKFEKVGENWHKGRSMVTKDILIRLQF